MTLEDIDGMDREYSEKSTELEEFEWEINIFAIISGTHNNLGVLDEDIDNSRLIIEKTIVVNESDRNEAYRNGFTKNKEWIKELNEKLPENCTAELYKDEIYVIKK